MKYLQKRIGSEVPVKEKKILKKKNPKVRVQNEAFYKKEIQENPSRSLKRKTYKKKKKSKSELETERPTKRNSNPGRVEEPKKKKNKSKPKFEAKSCKRKKKFQKSEVRDEDLQKEIPKSRLS